MVMVALWHRKTRRSELAIMHTMCVQFFHSTGERKKRKPQFQRMNEKTFSALCPFLQNDRCVPLQEQFIYTVALISLNSVGISLDAVLAFQKSLETTNDWCRSVKPIQTVFSNWDTLCASFPRVSCLI